MSACALAETCVFGKQSLEPILCGPLAPTPMTGAKLLGLPFFQRYGVNLPSSLTEGVSFTWGGFSLPTGVGVRYGQSRLWLAAFLGGLGPGDFRPLAQTRPSGHAWPGDLLDPAHSPLEAQPVHSLGSPSLPRPRFARHEPLWCRTLRLLSIAYDSHVLGLGPD